MKGLRFFTKTNCRHTWLIASYHSPHSLTWRWAFYVAFHVGKYWSGIVPRRVELSSYGGSRRIWLWGLYTPRRNNYGLQFTSMIPGLCTFSFSQQQSMWYRDLYYRLRDERDCFASVKRKQVRNESRLPDPTHPSPPRLQ